MRKRPGAGTEADTFDARETVPRHSPLRGGIGRLFGHYSAAFTLSRYTHLLPGDEAPALDLTAAIAADSGEATDDLALEPVLVK